MSFSSIRTCPSCHVQNRVPAPHLSHTGRCASCKSPLLPLSQPLEPDAAAFDEIVRTSPVPVLVDFWASWCGPCRTAAPEVAAVAGDLAGHVVVLKVNTEQHPELAGRYHVQSIPNFVVLREGRVVLQKAGVAPRAEMKRWIEQA